MGDVGLNKPFDRILKAFAEEAPGLFLRLLGIVGPETVFRLTPLRMETAPPVILPDYVAAVAVEAHDPFIFHVEFLAWYKSSAPKDVARYGGSLAWQYQLRVESVLLLLRPDGAPKEIPSIGEYTIGKTRVTHSFRTVRMWEIDPAPLLENNDPRLFPWAVLMKSTDEQVQTMAAAVAQFGDDETLGRFLSLGSARYDRKQLEEMLGGPKMGLVEAILEASSLVQEVKEKAASASHAEGHAKGHAEGEAKGRAEEARRLLRRALQAKFPALAARPEIDAIHNVNVLESLLIDEVLASQDPTRIQEAIAAAAQN
jgi:hypothetical protein